MKFVARPAATAAATLTQALALLACASPASSQTVLEVRGDESCRDCMIELRRVITLGSAEDPTSVQPVTSLARLSDGNYYVAPTASPGEISVYASDGQFVRSIGREGQGPGEFGPSIWIAGASESLLIVLDRSLLRMTVLNAGGRSVFQRQQEVSRWYSAVMLGDTTLAITAAGHPLQIVGRDGRVARTIGPTLPGADRPHESFRVLAPGREPGSLWAANPHGTTFEYHASGATRSSRIIRRVSRWYDDEVTAGTMSHWPYPHSIAGMWEDHRDRLWIVTWVAARTPRPMSEVNRMMEGESLASANNRDMDTIIEVVDLTTGRLLAQTRHDRFFQIASGGAHLFSIVDSDDGDHRLEVWSIYARLPAPR